MLSISLPKAAHPVRWLLLLVLFACAFSNAVASQEPLKVNARLSGGAATGDNILTITVADSAAKPLSDAKVTVDVGMESMDMGTAHPAVRNLGGGKYEAHVTFSMAGQWGVTVHVEAPEQVGVTRKFTFDAKARRDMGQGMQMGHMMGRLGPWSMSREASGTSWIPDSSPMFMKMLPKSGGFDLNVMGFITFDENRSGGKRGDSRFFSNSMMMLMGRKDAGGGGVFGFSVMASLDPVFNGEYGYPDLFQTGETAHGNKLTDYQHPHDLFDEVTVSYSHPIGRNLGAFVYGGPVGEPALGGPTFMHRPSGMDIPEAPISHHWFDSTHISWGVVTAGVNTSKWQLEGSVFNGHEPNENRYAPDPIRLDSASARFTINPSRNLSLNTSYGYLHSPESTDPGVDQHRITAAAIWSLPLAHGDNLSATAAFGRNVIQGKNSDAFLAEATWLSGPTSIFARWEHVEKDELVGIPPGNYMVNKFLLGGVRNVASKGGFDLGIGAYAGFYIFPSSLDPYYGSNPITLGAFLRIRPGRM